MQATAYCFWIRQLQLRLGSDQRSRTGGLEMWSNPRWISDQELKKFQNDVPSTTIWFMVQPLKTPPTSSVAWTAGMQWLGDISSPVVYDPIQWKERVINWRNINWLEDVSHGYPIGHGMNKLGSCIVCSQ